MSDIPIVLIDPALLAADAVGIVAGTIVGWGAIRAHEARRDAGARQHKGLALELASQADVLRCASR